MNPCNCGYYPDKNKCNCSEKEVKRYLNKLSQPLIDRIDICAEALQVNYKDLESRERRESSVDIRKRVMKARDIQLSRYKNDTFNYNSELPPKAIEKYCKLGKTERKILEQAFDKLNLSARAYHKIIKVARTISDLEESEQINSKHLIEAICYRSIDQKYWKA